jgi:hypothetical protein
MEVLWRAVIHFGTGKLLQLSSIQHRQFFSLTCVVSLHNYTEKKKKPKKGLMVLTDDSLILVGSTNIE